MLTKKKNNRWPKNNIKNWLTIQNANISTARSIVVRVVVVQFEPDTAGQMGRPSRLEWCFVVSRALACSVGNLALK